jgi:hypothetical protein
MNKTEALARASRAVSIWGQGTSWTVSCPWDRADVGGPSTTINCDSYAKARHAAARIRAGIALALMGRYTYESAYALDMHAGRARELVNKALETQ